MTDLVNRLNAGGAWNTADRSSPFTTNRDAELHRLAAAEIERLREALEDCERTLDILVHHGFLNRPKHIWRCQQARDNARAALEAGS